MPSFEDWRRAHQEGVQRCIKQFMAGGHGPKRARELALIEQNIITKRAQDGEGELPPPFMVDNPNFYYPGTLEKGISEK